MAARHREASIENVAEQRGSKPRSTSRVPPAPASWRDRRGKSRTI